MFYINSKPNESGNYGNPMGQSFEGCVALSDSLLATYIEARGFVTLTIENDIVVNLEINQDALDIYNETNKPDITSMKQEKVAQTKEDLTIYLATHPITWTDGNQYSVTFEKQQLLTSQLALYQTAISMNEPYTLEWNTTGDVCTEWTYEDLAALGLAIGAYVKQLVSYQQQKEIEIMACETIEEFNAIVVDYDSV